MMWQSTASSAIRSSCLWSSEDSGKRKSSYSQFHQHFTYEFFIGTSFWQLFSSYMYIEKTAKITFVQKSAQKTLMKLTPRRIQVRSKSRQNAPVSHVQLAIRCAKSGSKKWAKGLTIMTLSRLRYFKASSRYIWKLICIINTLINEQNDYNYQNINGNSPIALTIASVFLS